MALDGSGHAYLAYQQGGGTQTDVEYRNNVSGAFSAPVFVSAGSGTNPDAYPV